MTTVDGGLKHRRVLWVVFELGEVGDEMPDVVQQRGRDDMGRASSTLGGCRRLQHVLRHGHAPVLVRAHTVTSKDFEQSIDDVFVGHSILQPAIAPDMRNPIIG